MSDVNAFEGYADIYVDAPYNEFANEVARNLPLLLKKLGVEPARFIDLACGPGDLLMAASAVIPSLSQLFGLDRSQRMLEHARRRARGAGLNAAWVRADLSAIALRGEFDLITCTFNTVNYLLVEAQLSALFGWVASALSRFGVLLFDVQCTEYVSDTLIDRAFVLQNTDRVVEVWENAWYERNTTVESRVTAFLLDDEGWNRTTETHLLRLWQHEVIERLVVSAGMRIVKVADDLRLLGKGASASSERHWYVCRRAEVSLA
jgi:Methylase involved in ubiquinone/menaquinone biosynthesis